MRSFLEEAQALYRKLALEHHPDRGGDTHTIQEINRQWADFQTTYAKQDKRKRQAEAHSNGKKTAVDYHVLDEVFETLRVRIETALNLAAATMEHCCLQRGAKRRL